MNFIDQFQLELKLFNDFRVSNRKNELAYTLIAKHNVIFLVTKLEIFVQKILNQQIEKMQNTEMYVKDIEGLDKIIYQLSLKKINDVGNDHSNCEIQKLINNLNTIWDESFKIKDLHFDFKLHFYKHGSKAIQKYFNQINIDIFNVVKDYTDENDSLIEGSRSYDLSSHINKLIFYRNDIIHGDDFPGSLTENELDTLIKIVTSFINQVEDYFSKQYI